MEKLVDEGKVKAIGISNFSVKKTKELLTYAKHKPAANQVELHPYFRNSDISKFCQSEVRHCLLYSCFQLLLYCCANVQPGCSVCVSLCLGTDMVVFGFNVNWRSESVAQAHDS